VMGASSIGAMARDSGPTDANKTQFAKELKQAEEEMSAAISEGWMKDKGIIAGMQSQLGRFGYGVGPFNGVMDSNTVRALKAYQKHKGLPETGKLDVATNEGLMHDDFVLQHPPIRTPEKKSFQKDEHRKLIQISGRWSDPKERAYPVSLSDIVCFKDKNLCFDAEATMLGPTQLRCWHVVWDVASWNSTEIVSKPQDIGDCYTRTLRIKLTEESATILTSPTGNCGGTEEHSSTLVDGDSVWGPLADEYRSQKKSILQN
ncbi:MAG TPA: peptidoglycan-binding domain-containing protein, partial [Elusimicrobiota bacterium]|nr:peptidoglycan-binding domain-containing protein [Elusimicrobiota bacterium]